MTIHIDFPFHFDEFGRTAASDDDGHIRDMIEQFLFTNLGERVNRPGFGSGLLHFVFEPTSPGVAAVLQANIHAGLQQWLGELIDIHVVRVTSEESTVRVVIEYVVRRTGATREAEFEQGGMV